MTNKSETLVTSYWRETKSVQLPLNFDKKYKNILSMLRREELPVTTNSEICLSPSASASLVRPLQDVGVTQTSRNHSTFLSSETSLFTPSLHFLFLISILLDRSFLKIYVQYSQLDQICFCLLAHQLPQGTLIFRSHKSIYKSCIDSI